MIILIAVLFQTHLQIFTWKEIKKNYQTFPEKTHDIFLIIPQIKDLKVLQYIKHVILFLNEGSLPMIMCWEYNIWIQICHYSFSKPSIQGENRHVAYHNN